jgi:pilus assembly protein Flp/PilA
MDAVVALVQKLKILRQDEGQDLIEYGLLAALIAIIAIAAMTSVGTTINDLFYAKFPSAI